MFITSLSAEFTIYNIIKNSIMKSLIFAIIHYSGTA